MTETANKRRRWPWVILGSLLLLIGGAIAWQLRPGFRPLNAFEVSLLGTWRSSDEMRLFDEIALTADRRFVLVKGHVSGAKPNGRWAASSGTLILYLEAKSRNPIQLVLNATERFAPKLFLGVVPAGPNQLRITVVSPPGELYERIGNPVGPPPLSP
jgi:hypothetical protein